MRVATAIACWFLSTLGLSAGAAAQNVTSVGVPIAIGVTADGGAPFSAAQVNLTSPGSGPHGPQTPQIAAKVLCS